MSETASSCKATGKAAGEGRGWPFNMVKSARKAMSKGRKKVASALGRKRINGEASNPPVEVQEQSVPALPWPPRSDAQQMAKSRMRVEEMQRDDSLLRDYLNFGTVAQPAEGLKFPSPTPLERSRGSGSGSGSGGTRAHLLQQQREQQAGGGAAEWAPTTPSPRVGDEMVEAVVEQQDSDEVEDVFGEAAEALYGAAGFGSQTHSRAAAEAATTPGRASRPVSQHSDLLAMSPFDTATSSSTAPRAHGSRDISEAGSARNGSGTARMPASLEPGGSSSSGAYGMMPPWAWVPEGKKLQKWRSGEDAPRRAALPPPPPRSSTAPGRTSLEAPAMAESSAGTGLCRWEEEEDRSSGSGSRSRSRASLVWLSSEADQGRGSSAIPPAPDSSLASTSGSAASREGAPASMLRQPVARRVSWPSQMQSAVGSNGAVLVELPPPRLSTRRSPTTPAVALHPPPAAPAPAAALPPRALLPHAAATAAEAGTRTASGEEEEEEEEEDRAVWRTALEVRIPGSPPASDSGDGGGPGRLANGRRIQDSPSSVEGDHGGGAEDDGALWLSAMDMGAALIAGDAAPVAAEVEEEEEEEGVVWRTALEIGPYSMSQSEHSASEGWDADDEQLRLQRGRPGRSLGREGKDGEAAAPEPVREGGGVWSSALEHSPFETWGDAVEENGTADALDGEVEELEVEEQLNLVVSALTGGLGSAESRAAGSLLQQTLVDLASFQSRHPAKLLRRYTITAQPLMIGGTSVVAHAIEQVGGRELPCAVKFFLKPQRFEHESAFFNTFRPPFQGVVGFLDEDPDPVVWDGQLKLPPYIIMERGDVSLQDVLSSGTGKLRQREHFVRDLLLDIVEALHELHSRSVAYCDLKPANVMYFGRQFRWKLVDVGSWTQHGVPGPAAFTLRYAAPEVVQETCRLAMGVADKTRSMSRRVEMDLWSLGCLVFEVVTGQQLLDHNRYTDGDVALMLLGRRLLPWQTDPAFWSAIPNPMARELVSSLLVRQPHHRWTTAQVLRSSFLSGVMPQTLNRTGTAPTATSMRVLQQPRR